MSTLIAEKKKSFEKGGKSLEKRLVKGLKLCYTPRVRFPEGAANPCGICLERRV
ncbi:MAG: hypothetical protein IJ188_00870 [Clostridia bacterium]|nr:hypothetical protein [Clostridia bacterium]